ncbi:hypothetical protein KQ310_01305 [Synechococcus sp. CS-1328]|nr:hypothetical protein [Synechococcus sp. CS-1328]
MTTTVNLPGVGPVTQTTPVTIDTTNLQPNGGIVTVSTPNGTVTRDLGNGEVQVDRKRSNGKQQKTKIGKDSSKQKSKIKDSSKQKSESKGGGKSGKS